MGNHLERAAAAADSGAWRDCLSALVEAWRPMRVEPLGHAIERVSALLEEGRPPPGGLKRHAEWLARAAKKDIADVGLLADSVSDQKPAEAEANMEAMADWPEDPRIARAMLVNLIALRYADRTRAWKALGSLIIRNADERFRSEIELLRDGEPQHSDVKARNACIKRLVKELLPVLVESDTKLSAADQKRVARVNAAVDAYYESEPNTERKLLDAINADRESDAPFLVYADWLSERGHPRGELIVLKCKEKAGTLSEEEKTRMFQICNHHPRAILGAAANVIYAFATGIDRRRATFDRGVLDVLEVMYSPPTWTFAESPSFRAIRKLEAGKFGKRALSDVMKMTAIRKAKS